MLEEQDEKQAVQEEQETLEHKEPVEAEAINASGKNISIHPVRPRRRWLRTLEQVVAAVLVLGIVSGWIVLTHLPRATSFSDAGVPSLGAPAVTYQGNATYVYGWSPDNRTLAILQANTQQNTLDVRMIDAATGKATVYPVLDGSWIPALEQYDAFGIEQGRYLIAMRPQSKTQATLEIWDIIRQRPVTIQTVPGYAPAAQLLSPFISSSENQQKFALFASGGQVTIWDVATGKHVALTGTVSWNQPALPQSQWYDNDQFFMVSNDNSNNPSLPNAANIPAQLIAWNVATGQQIINLSDPGKVYQASVSPDGKTLALQVGTWQTTSEPKGDSVGHIQVDTLELFDAQTGQALHTYPLHVASNVGVGFSWQPDSRHMLARYTTVVDEGTSPPLEKFYNWDTVTGQQTFLTSEAHFGLDAATTPDGHYLFVYRSDNRTVDIWQVSSESKVATIYTPGVPAATDVIYGYNNQNLIIGRKDTFDIWDIATGKLIYKYHGPTPFSIQSMGEGTLFWSPDNKYLVMLAWKQTSANPTSIGDASLTIWRNP